MSEKEMVFPTSKSAITLIASFLLWTGIALINVPELMIIPALGFACCFVLIFGEVYKEHVEAKEQQTSVQTSQQGIFISKKALVIGSIVVALCVGYFFGSSPSPPSSSSSSSSSSSYSSSKKKKQTFRQCITNGESVYEKCVLKNSRGKLRKVCERQWLSHLSTCCRLYPDDARSSLQCLSL